jgi:hypothetical protein
MPERPAPSAKPVPVKLLFKPGFRALIVDAPPGYVEQFPSDAHIDRSPGGGEYDFIQMFARDKATLLAEAARLREQLSKPGGILWFCYPKGKTLPTDLNRDVARLSLRPLGLEVVSQVAIDDTWSALRARLV